MKTKGGTTTVISGNYVCKEGDVLEERDGCTTYYYCYKGHLYILCDKRNAVSLNSVKSFLKGDIDIETLCRFLNLSFLDKKIEDKTSETQDGVLDELKD